MSDTPVTVAYEGDIAVVTVDNPPVNALRQAVRQGLLDAVEAIKASDAKAAILVCAGRTFIAGADIREFDKGPFTPALTDVVNAIESNPKPWIAAIHGTALGGGLEVALGCHHRVAAPTGKMGLPEVHLGLLPGAGGTQRLPRLTGAAEAVKMVTSGAPVGAAKALELGLISEIVEGDLTAGALAYAEKVKNDPVVPIDRNPITPKPSETEWSMMRTAVEKAAKGQTSPLDAMAMVKRAFEVELEDGLKEERDTFLRLKDGDQSRAMRHAFFSERAVAKPPQIKGAAPREVNRIAVIGGGLMGAGIATSLLTAGCKVAMIERDGEAAEAGRARVDANLAGGVKRGKMSEGDKDALMANLTAGSDYALTADADLAIEAVFEELDVKQAVFRQLDAAMRPDAILATNTSYINPNMIAEGVSNPERVIGMHFFSPAHVMRLVEVVQADQTSAEVIATAFAISKRMKKVAALSGVCEGFIGNRILASYRRVCEYMAEDMRQIENIDAAIRNYGLPMGPFQLMDLAGLQIGWATRKRLAPTRDPNVRYARLADTLCEAGRFGQKTGAGYYRYEEGNRKPISDPFTANALADAAGDRPTRSYSEEEIQNRALAVMVNEGAMILDEGVAARPLDIDMVKIFGYAFPRWRGGPMMAADIMGVDKVLAVMEEIAAADEGSWKISPLLRRIAGDGGGFGALNA